MGPRSPQAKELEDKFLMTFVIRRDVHCDYPITLGLSSATAIVCVSRLPPASFHRDLERPLFTFTEFRGEDVDTWWALRQGTLCATPA